MGRFRKKYGENWLSLIRCFSIGVLTILLLPGCYKDMPVPPLPDCTPTTMTIEVPTGWSGLIYHDDNPLTAEGVALGRMLYYDNILSMNGNACASCHLQSAAFAGPGVGPNGNDIPAHINLGFNDNFGWTGFEDWLDHVALADLEEGNVFLNANNDTILERLRNHETYQQMFRDAFCIDITEVALEDRKHYIAFALAQFMRTQISTDSKFDRWKRQEAGVDFTQSEFNGYVIFMTEKGDCFHCHGEPLFSDDRFHNIGLDSVFTAANAGRYNVTWDSADVGKFATPTLRNIALTGPYMHDARFSTLEEVVDHYNSGVIHTEYVDPIMAKPGKQFGLGLTATEKQDLINFLHTLTDSSFISDTTLSSPF